MNKMKRNLVFKILNSNITSYEFDLIIFLTTIQEEDGTVASIYYKNIKDNLKCSVATVYNIINGLEKKGFVKKEKNLIYLSYSMKFLTDKFCIVTLILKVYYFYKLTL